MRHAGTAALALALACTAACASGRHLATIDRRLSHLEESQQDRKQQLDLIEQQIGALARAITAVGAAADVRELASQLDALSDEVAAIAAKVAAPPPAKARRAEPQPDEVYAVAVAGAATVGPADALVTIVSASEYACPYCEKVRHTLEQIRALYPDEVRIVYRSFVVHPRDATLPAQAACAADKQGLFAQADARLFDEAYAQRTYDQAEMELIATEIGADLDQFRADMSGPCATQVQADQAALASVGVGATPTFFINGHYLAGNQPIGSFTTVIDAELALARTRLGKKATSRKARAKYYDTWVMAKGKTSFVP